MYTSTGRTISVNGRNANISFASFLRDRMNKDTNVFRPQFMANAPQPLPHTINDSQVIFSAYREPLAQRGPLRAPFDRDSFFAQAHNMTPQAQGHFKDYVHNPDDLYLSTNLAAPPVVSGHGVPVGSSFWPTVTNQQTAAGPRRAFEFKTENSPGLPTPSVLPQHVDVSKYEDISYDDWYKAPTLYHSTSPSSIEYYANSPATPDDMFSDYSFDIKPNTNMLGYVPDGQNLSYSSEGLPEKKNPIPFAFPPMTYQASNSSLPHGLPDAHLRSDTLPFRHPVLAQYHHHSIESLRPRSQDLDFETSPHSEEGLDDAPSPASSHSPPYDFATTDIEARQRRDATLLKMRREGYSYRDIKHLGRFKEAESTLRGRYRALTKDREDRVRRPQWQANDERLLRQAVRHYSSNGGRNKVKMRYGRRKLPWKKISQRMKDHGSSYLFAPATCAKKWENLTESSTN